VSVFYSDLFIIFCYIVRNCRLKIQWWKSKYFKIFFEKKFFFLNLVKKESILDNLLFTRIFQQISKKMFLFNSFIFRFSKIFENFEIPIKCIKVWKYWVVFGLIKKCWKIKEISKNFWELEKIIFWVFSSNKNFDQKNIEFHESWLKIYFNYFGNNFRLTVLKGCWNYRFLCFSYFLFIFKIFRVFFFDFFRNFFENSKFCFF
jgi:hypothetical protein